MRAPRRRIALDQHLRHTGVVQINRPATSADAAVSERDPAGSPQLEPTGHTRSRVARLVLGQGPITAVAIAEQLQLTAAAVRRHLDSLYEAGLVTIRESRPTARRGRPAKAYVLTDAGHRELTSAYDGLAASALTYLGEQLGPDAVRQFADRRVAELERRYAPLMADAGPKVGARTQALAAAMTADGYAASTRPMPTGDQLCQGHCPIQQVAHKFPQLCEAETDAISRLLGVHVQRLATLAGGAHVCTTHVPHSPTASAPLDPKEGPRHDHCA